MKRTHTKRSGVRRGSKMKIDKESNDYAILKVLQKKYSGILGRNYTEKEVLSLTLRICNNDIDILASYIAKMK